MKVNVKRTSLNTLRATTASGNKAQGSISGSSSMQVKASLSESTQAVLPEVSHIKGTASGKKHMSAHIALCRGGIDTSDATATPGDILKDKTAYADGEKIVGAIPTYDGTFSGGEEYEQYEGEYSVSPKFTEQTLPTAKKILTEDVRVEEIPYFEVSNNAGGTTVTIG